MSIHDSSTVETNQLGQISSLEISAAAPQVTHQAVAMKTHNLLMQVDFIEIRVEILFQGTLHHLAVNSDVRKCRKRHQFQISWISARAGVSNIWPMGQNQSTIAALHSLFAPRTIFVDRPLSCEG